MTLTGIVDLNFNKISGTQPTELDSLFALTLSLLDNNFQGTIVRIFGPGDQPIICLTVDGVCICITPCASCFLSRQAPVLLARHAHCPNRRKHGQSLHFACRLGGYAKPRIQSVSAEWIRMERRRERESCSKLWLSSLGQKSKSWLYRCPWGPKIQVLADTACISDNWLMIFVWSHPMLSADALPEVIWPSHCDGGSLLGHAILRKQERIR